jgi:hypothetical protein
MNVNGNGHGGAPGPTLHSAPQQEGPDLSRAAVRARLIRGLPIERRLRELLLAVDRHADAWGIREGHVTTVEVTIRELSATAGCSERTLFNLLKAIREKPCRYLDVDPKRGRTSLYSMSWGAIIEDSRPVGSLSKPAGRDPCKTSAKRLQIAPLQNRRKPPLQNRRKPRGSPITHGSNGNGNENHGVLKSDRPKTGGWPRRLTREILKKPADVWDLYLFAKRRKPPWVGDSEVDKERFFGAAVHACIEGTEPGALFTRIIKRKDWKLVGDDDRAEGKRMLASLRTKPGPGERVPVPTMKGPPPEESFETARTKQQAGLAKWTADRNGQT